MPPPRPRAAGAAYDLDESVHDVEVRRRCRPTVPVTKGPFPTTSGSALRTTSASDRAVARGDATVLLPFAQAWDEAGFARLTPHPHYVRVGFDVCSPLGILRTFRFDAERTAKALAARHGRIDGVVSHHEHVGTLTAALIAAALGLPGTAPAAILACQHKLHARQVLARVAPEATPAFRLLPGATGNLAAVDLPLPWFVKPVRGTFSILARRIDRREELLAHRRLRLGERMVIAALLRSFDRSARAHLGTDVRGSNLLAEPFCTWSQYNLDGFMFAGRAHAIGVTAEEMYPGTQAFVRFTYPSPLPLAAQAKALAIAERFLRAVGFTHGLFNLEFFHDQATGAITVIEVNPRLGSQLADLYDRVEGVDPYAISIELALGRDPAHLPRRLKRGGIAASFVFRTFDGRTPRSPDATARARLLAAFPDAILFAFRSRGAALRSELRWLGSHRYGTLNLHGDDEADLERRYRHACGLLGWPVQPAPARLTPCR